MTKCSHKNYLPTKPDEKIWGKIEDVCCSLNEVYCLDCRNFIDLNTGRLINHKGLLVDEKD